MKLNPAFPERSPLRRHRWLHRFENGQIEQIWYGDNVSKTVRGPDRNMVEFIEFTELLAWKHHVRNTFSQLAGKY